MSTPTVAGYCNLLGRSRLLSADETRSLLGRWQTESGPAAEDPQAFLHWLVSRRYLTDYQADLLRREHVDRFFLGEYKLLERIGQGRMAGVYKAVHRLGQTVAIKVLPPSKVKDAQAFGRFQREARLALKLDHPNIVRTLEAGEDRGLHYIVMEHLDGETFDEVLQKRGKLPIAEAVDVVYQALLGLEHLHAQDMVHRDLKPANLMMLAADGGKVKVKILDVGLGRALFDEGDPNSGGPIELTAPGEMLGNPDYMAPEQARDAHSADIRADLYSSGCILYHALAGQPPFADSNAVRKMMRHAAEAPRPVKTFDPTLPDGIDSILERMLAKDPAMRYSTPDQAASALRPFLPGVAGPPVAMPVAVAVPVAKAPPPPPPTVPANSEKVRATPPRKEKSEGDLLSRRDWFLLATGAVGVAGALGIGLLLARWFGGKRDE